jgi:hypothetical protein
VIGVIRAVARVWNAVRRYRPVMPYGWIVLVASVALVVYFDFKTRASWITKVIVSGLFLFCVASFFGWIAVHPLIRLFLMVGLSIFIIFYRIVQQTRTSK